MATRMVVPTGTFGVKNGRVGAREGANFNHKSSVTDRDTSSVHDSLNPFADGVNEFCRLGEFYLAIKSALHNCDCQGMFAGALQAGSEAKHLIGIGWGLKPYPNQLRFAYGERSGFIDDEGVNFFQNLESLGVFDEHSGAGSAAYADHDGHGGCESESAGARDD